MYIVDSLYNVTKNEEKESRYAYRIISGTSMVDKHLV